MRKGLFAALLLFFCFPGPLFSQESYTLGRAQKEVFVTGYTRADHTATLSSELPGRVREVHYDVGDTAGKKPFVSLDPTFVLFDIAATRAGLDKLSAAAEKNGSHVAYLEKEFGRIEGLHKEDRATEVRRDAAAQELNQARLDEKTIEAEQASLNVTLSQLTERRRRHDVFAPEGWVLVARMVEPGENVAAGQPLGRAADFSRLTVPLCVTPEELASMEEMGKSFEAFLEGQKVKASIKWVNPEFDERSRKRCIELVIADYKGEHRGGLALSLPLSVDSPGLLVDKRAVSHRYENPRVTLAEDGKSINVLVLSESGGNVILADDGRLSPGMKLLPANGK